MSPTQMLSHLKSSRHKNNITVVDKTQYDNAIQISNIAAEIPIPPLNDNLPPVYGLAIAQGFYCSHCDYTSESQESMKRHQRIVHDTVPLAQRHFTPGSIQRLNASNHKTWFRIQTPHSTT